MGTSIVIRTDGSRERQAWDTPPPLEWLQSQVGGYIEIIPHFDRFEGAPVCIAYCNEEGKLHGLPLNEEATRLWYESSGQQDDVLAGDVVVLYGDEQFLEAL